MQALHGQVHPRREADIVNRIQQLVTSVFLLGVILALGAAAVVVAVSLVQRRHVELRFEPRDVWVGTYIDSTTGAWYVCPFPGVLIKTTPRQK